MLGGGLDRALVHRCAAVATISPLLRARLIARCPGADERVRYVPLPAAAGCRRLPIQRLRARGPSRPWPRRPRAGRALHWQSRRLPGSRRAASGHRGGSSAYGCAVPTRGDRQQRQRVCASRARACGLGAHVHVTSMGRGAAPAAEATRARLHAAADVVAYCHGHRAAGLPIKLLDALGHAARDASRCQRRVPASTSAMRSRRTR